MMYLLIGAVIVAALHGLSQLASSDRFSKMSEKEFEEEARRSSMMGAAMSSVQKIFDPSHHVEYVEEQQDRAGAEASHPGGQPPEKKPLRYRGPQVGDYKGPCQR